MVFEVGIGIVIKVNILIDIEVDLIILSVIWIEVVVIFCVDTSKG